MGELQTLANDYVWTFAGGTPSNDFLKKVGVSFGTQDITLEASLEARLEQAAKRSALR